MKERKLKPILDFDDADLDEVIGSFDKIIKISSFADINLREGSWILEIQIPNTSKDKKKMFPVLKFCKKFKIFYQLINKNRQYYILKFIPLRSCLVTHFPPKAVAILDQYIIKPEGNDKKIKITVQESTFSHGADDVDQAIACIIDDVEGNSGELIGNSINQRPVSDSPEIIVDEELEFDDFGSLTIELDAEAEIVDDNEVEIVDAEVEIVDAEVEIVDAEVEIVDAEVEIVDDNELLED